MTEVPVYDRATRWSLTVIVTLLDVIPAVALVLWIGQTNSRLALSFSGFLAIVLTGLFLFVYFSMDIWIGIDPSAKKLFRLYKLFGRSIYRRVHDITPFDHITVRRRGIVYRAILVGLEREMVLAASRKFDLVRQKAERIAILSGIRLTEQL